MKLTKENLIQLIGEELTKADKKQIKAMVTKEVDSSFKQFEKSIKKTVEEELYN